MQVEKKGVSVTIGQVVKDGRRFYRVFYREQGKRKQAWRADFKDAKRVADDAIDAILTGDASALKLNARTGTPICAPSGNPRPMTEG